MTIVWPKSSTAILMKSSSSAPAFESRLPLGSSAKTIAGRETSALAAATRCCSPPESSAGRWPSLSPTPTASTTWSNQSWSGSSPAIEIGSRMFSSALSVGTRLKAWNTKPTRSRRSIVRSRSLSMLSSTSPNHTWPDVRLSRPAMQWSSVDLPDPDGPMMALKRPLSNSAVTPSSARTTAPPSP